MFRKLAPFAAFKRFYFKDPDSHRVFEGSSIQDVAVKVRSYRMQNELSEIEFLEAIIENYLCKKPENIGACEGYRLKRGLWETLKGGIAVLTNLVYDKTVTQEEADTRSEICKSCPANVFPDKGPFVSWADRLAEASVGDLKSKHHTELGNCAHCTCCLRPKVFYAGKISLTKEDADKMLASSPNCWQVKEWQKAQVPEV